MDFTQATQDELIAVILDNQTSHELRMGAYYELIARKHHDHRS